MRKFAVILFLAAAGALLWAGCSEDDHTPYFTRVTASAECGVAPLIVQFTARATGGNPLSDPTGANDYLEITWDFGDGNGATGSLVHHTYTTPDDYTVVVRLRDDDGEGDPYTLNVSVRADSLAIRAYPDTTVAPGQAVPFTVYADICGFDKNTGNYSQRFLYRWRMGDVANTVYFGRSPQHAYTAADLGARQVIVTVIDDQFYLTRHDTLTVLVQAP